MAFPKPSCHMPGRNICISNNTTLGYGNFSKALGPGSPDDLSGPWARVLVRVRSLPDSHGRNPPKEGREKWWWGPSSDAPIPGSHLCVCSLLCKRPLTPARHAEKGRVHAPVVPGNTGSLGQRSWGRRSGEA